MSDNKISVYDLGAGGVNLVKSPLELADNEVTKAQNAEPYNDTGRSGLRKRLGLQRVTPTGTVTPTGVGTNILGGFVIDDPAGWASPVPTEQSGYGNGGISTDGGVTWIIYTPTQDPVAGNVFPNTIYNLATGYDSTKTPQFPPLWVDGTYYMGGSTSGQVIAAYLGLSRAPAPAPAKQIYSREEVRVPGTGSANDTVILPGVFNDSDFSQSPWLVVSVMGVGITTKGLFLYSPSLGITYALPTLGTTALVTGSYSLNGWLFVVAGLKLYGINLTLRDGTETWVNLATVSDTGVTAMTGLTAHPFNPYLLLAGTQTSSNAVRVYGFLLAVSPFGPTASLTSQATVASCNQNAAAAIFGPFPPLPNDTRISMFYVGNAPSFTTLQGSPSNADTMAGVSSRILTYDNQFFHNGIDTGSDNLVSAPWGGATSRNPGPFVNIANRIQMMYTRVGISGGNTIAESRRTAGAGISWSVGSVTPGGALLDSLFVFPPVLLF